MQGDHGRRAVKTGFAQGRVGTKMQSAFPEFYLRSGLGRLLALWGLGRYISVEFPDIASASASGADGADSSGF
jgi:hypothetical protein